MLYKSVSGEDGIRTHVAVKPNGFQDRLVMTASIPLQIFIRRLYVSGKDNNIINNIQSQAFF